MSSQGGELLFPPRDETQIFHVPRDKASLFVTVMEAKGDSFGTALYHVRHLYEELNSLSRTPFTSRFKTSASATIFVKLTWRHFYRRRVLCKALT